MRNIDFLSEYPRIFIFEKEVNKTNFGGILFLLYIIIMLIISAYYLSLFCLNDKYKIEYLSINNQTLAEDIDELDKNQDLNPTLEFKMMVPYRKEFQNFKVAIQRGDDIQIIENYNTYWRNGKKIGTTINSSVSKFTASLVYFCGKDSTCLNHEKDLIYDNTSIELDFDTPLKKIDHQNHSKPISDEYYLSYRAKLNTTFDKPILSIYNWKVIKYKEKKGLALLFDKIFGIKNEYFAGYYESNEQKNEENYIEEINGNYYKHLIDISISNSHHEYDEYTREKITILDVISTISALFSPIKLGFLFIYGFYSKNFNNYKIIENVLNKRHNITNHKKELKNFLDLKDSSINDPNDNEKQEILIKTDLIEKNDDNIEEINEKEDDDDSEFRLNKKERILPKYSFMQFFLNNIYCKSWKKCAKYEKQQKILQLCNDINKKYLSIDSILYNQIMIENLLRDHIWNNYSLNNIKNNELILKLQTLIE